MQLLRFLESVRTPLLTAFFSLITNLGSEGCFIVIAMSMLWCARKKDSYYLFSVGFFALGMSHLLKIIFRLPRPWVIDPAFTIVEAARAGASGYSFPSGHATLSVASFGALALTFKKKLSRTLCILIAILIPFSRLYLGVHTPLDVAAGALLSLFFLLLLRSSFSSDEQFRKRIPLVFSAAVLLTVFFFIYLYVYPFPADTDLTSLADGYKAAYTLLGCCAGMTVTYLYTRGREDCVRAPLSVQLLKVASGLVLLLVLRAGLKSLFALLFPGSYFADSVRYFLLILVAGCIIPLTFPLFRNTDRKG